MANIEGLRKGLILILLAFAIPIAASTVNAATWNPGNGVYSDTTKWDTGVAPCDPTDDVVFPDGFYTVTLDLTCTVGSLDLGNGVTLQVTSAIVYSVAGAATIRGSVSVTAAGGEISAPNAVFPGAATNQLIHASNNGAIDFAGMATLNPPAGGTSLIEVDLTGGGSIDLSGLITIAAAGGYTLLDVHSGSTLSLPAVTTIEDTRMVASGGGQILVNGPQPVSYASLGLNWTTFYLLDATGAGTLMDLSSITTLDTAVSDPGTGTISQFFLVNDTAHIDLSGVTEIPRPVERHDYFEIQLTNNGTIDLSGVTAVGVSPGNTGYINLDVQSGSTMSLPSVTAIEDTQMMASGGGQVLVNGPQPVSYSSLELNWTTFYLLNATGAGTLMDLSSITTLDTAVSDLGAGTISQFFLVNDTAHIDLSGVTEMPRPVERHDYFEIQLTNNGTIDLSGVTAVGVSPGNTGYINLDVQSGSTMSLPAVTAIEETNIGLSQTSNIILGQVLFDQSFNMSVASASTMHAGALIAGPLSDGVIALNQADIDFDVDGTFDLGDDVALTINQPNTHLHLGGHFLHSNQTPASIQLESAIVHFDGAATQRMEIAGADAGTTPPPSPNFGVGQIIVGQAGQSTVVQLEDLVDNGSGGGGVEALYLLGLDPLVNPAPGGLRIDGGSTLSLGCLAVYVCDDNTDTVCDPLLDQLTASGMTSIPYDNGFVQIDGDDDGDGVPTCLDNCPRTPNPEQGDADEDGIGDRCDYEIPLDSPAFITEIPGLGGGAETGASLAAAGDLNNDGIDDFLVGAPGYSDGIAMDAGAVGVYFGSPDVMERGVPEVVFTGVEAHDRAGVSVAGNFDFNGDGLPDILIGVEQMDRTVDPPVPAGTGKAYLIYFDPTDTVLYPNIANPLVEDFVDLAGVGTTVPGVVFEGVALGDLAGFAVAAGGRVNAGPGQDILIGAPGWNAAAGVTYLIFDDPALTGTVSLARVANGLGDQVAGIRYEGATAGDEVGFSVAFPGDVVDDPAVVNDTGDDVAFGSPGADTSAPGAGILYIHAGGGLVTDIVEPVSIGGDEPGTKVKGRQQLEGLGYSVSGGGDNLVDGSDDLLIGAPFYDRGSAPQNADAGRVIQTSSKLPNGSIEVDSIGAAAGEPDAIPGVIYVGAAGFDHLGEAVAGLRDVTKDGFADIAFSAPLADPNGLFNAGIIYLSPGYAPADFHLGVIDLARGFAGTQFTGIQVGEMAGKALAGVGDIEGDGDDDFLAGAPGNDSAVLGIDAGVVYTIVDCTEVDTDGDGFVDCDDNCPLDFNPGQEDLDNDGLGDGVGDVCDNCPGDDNPFQADVDRDGWGDSCDGCPRNSNPLQEDTDGDGTQDACDSCPAISNASQRDMDGDGMGDACDSNPTLYVSMNPFDDPDFGMIQDAIDEAQEPGTRISISPKSGGACYGDPDMSININNGLGIKLTGDGSDVCISSTNEAAIVALAGGGTVLLENLRLEGRIGVLATASLDIRNVRFRNITELALDLDAGTHELSDIDMDSSVENGIDLAGSAIMTVERASLDGLQGTAMTIGGTAVIGATLIARTFGGVVLGSGATLTLRHSTVADNSSPGIDGTGAAGLLIEHSILWGNMGADMIGAGCEEALWSLIGAPNCAGSGDNISCPPDFVGVDPIDPADPTRYYHLQPSSCALDYGPDPSTYTGAPCVDLERSQRLKDYDGNGLAQVDVGAYEMMKPGLPASLVTGLMWVDDATLWWNGHAGATEYHLYRESMSMLGYDAFGMCHDAIDPDRTDTMLIETGTPALGEAWMFVITIEDGIDEQSLGLGTCAERSNFTPCP